MNFHWPKAFTDDTKIQAFILGVLSLTFLYTLLHDSFNAFFGRKRIKFINISTRRITGQAYPWSRVEILLTNGARKTIFQRHFYIITNDGKVSDSDYERDSVVKEGEDYAFTVDVKGVLVPDDGIKRVVLVDSLNKSYIGYVYRGIFVGFWKFYFFVITDWVIGRILRNPF